MNNFTALFYAEIFYIIGPTLVAIRGMIENFKDLFDYKRALEKDPVHTLKYKQDHTHDAINMVYAIFIWISFVSLSALWGTSGHFAKILTTAYFILFLCLVVFYPFYIYYRFFYAKIREEYPHIKKKD